MRLIKCLLNYLQYLLALTYFTVNNYEYAFTHSSYQFISINQAAIPD